MEVRKEMPEEVRRELEEKKAKIKEVTEKIPEKYQKKIEESAKRKRQHMGNFLQLSISICNARKQQTELLDKITAIDKGIGTTVQDAFKKMKLNRRKNYRWRFDGKGNFIGMYAPPKQVPKENK